MPPSRSAKLAPSTSKTEIHNSVVVEDLSKDSCEYGAGLSLLYPPVNGPIRKNIETRGFSSLAKRRR